MRLKNNVILFAAVLFAVAGCNPAAKFSVKEAEMPSLNGLSSLHGKATVENAGGRDVMVENATFTVRYRDRELGSARLMLPIEIPAKGTTEIRYDFALDSVSLSSMQTIQSRIYLNPDAFTVDVDGWFRWGGIRKKIEMKGVELIRIMEIINTFAP
jgi:hypothetical protein